MYNELWVNEISVNECAVADSAAELSQRQSNACLVLEPLLLLKAITVIDLTTLAGDDTKSNVIRLVNKAVRPLRANTLTRLRDLIVDLIQQIRGIQLTDLVVVTELNGHCLHYEDVVELKSLLKCLKFDSGDVSKALNKFLTPQNELNDESEANFTVGAICVYPSMVHIVADTLKQKRMIGNAANVPVEDTKIGSYRVPIAAVAAGFPAGQYGINSKISEIEFAVRSGASEIDVVISRSLVLGERWEELYLEIKTLKEACGEATMKTILAVGECGSLENVYKASMIAMMAGSDYIKTSTGKETVNATLPVGIVMCRAIRSFYLNTGKRIGFKPAGGLRTAEDAMQWLRLIITELGAEWLSIFRIGASGLLDNIEKRLVTIAS